METTLRDRTVLVTGGAGFIGRHLVAELLEHNEVRVLDNGTTGDPNALPGAVEYVEGDVRDAAAVAESVEDPRRTHDVNLDGTLTVLEAARRHDSRVVFASSAAVYGHPNSVPVAEDDPTDPTSPYGVQKLAGDQYVRLYADLYDLETVALRYFNVYGPGQRGGDYAGVITAFLDRVRAGDPPVVHGDGTQTRDFVHVSDIVRANLLAATTDATGEAYNVGSGSSVTIRDLAERLVSLADADLAVEFGPERTGDIEESEADISKARSALGYDPQVEFSEGLSELVE